MSEQVQHGMVPGSHERPDGPECRCGAEWDKWFDRCATALAAAAEKGGEDE